METKKEFITVYGKYYETDSLDDDSVNHLIDLGEPIRGDVGGFVNDEYTIIGQVLTRYDEETEQDGMPEVGVIDINDMGNTEEMDDFFAREIGIGIPKSYQIISFVHYTKQ